jgi:RTX calcium-binding nonapeptide repeat (4 copies)
LKRRRTAPAAVGAASVALLALGASAQAATVSVEGDALRVIAAPGEANQLGVAVSPTDFAVTVTDWGAPLMAGPGCGSAADGSVDCPPPGTASTVPVARIEIDAGDLDDSVSVAAGLPAHVLGGDGNDALSAATTTLDGAPGAAVLDGGLGDDRLQGGDGDDTLLGGGGADFADGGAGDDSIEVRDTLSDSAWCGVGRDSVRAETLDALDVGCERVDYGPPGRVGRLVSITGGGRWVPIPGQTWARVDRRILADVLYLVRRYRVRITEGFATVGHERFGEHPLGLAVDIEPGPGGTWADVSRVARWAEPRQNHPRFPFRWVGWNGDRNHGHPSVCKRSRGCAPHLHLSWSHSPARPRHVAKTVWVWQVR